jgi:YHS domain-containing protein
MAAVSAIRRLFAPMFGTAPPRPEPNRGGPTSSGKLVADPVCGTYISTATAHSLTEGEKTFYFCSEECRLQFRHHA